jgi:hypothetical protein
MNIYRGANHHPKQPIEPTLRINLIMGHPTRPTRPDALKKPIWSDSINVTWVMIFDKKLDSTRKNQPKAKKPDLIWKNLTQHAQWGSMDQPDPTRPHTRHRSGAGRVKQPTTRPGPTRPDLTFEEVYTHQHTQSIFGLRWHIRSPYAWLWAWTAQRDNAAIVSLPVPAQPYRWYILSNISTHVITTSNHFLF